MGNNCTCNERFKKNEKDDSISPTNKTSRNKRPMFFEEISFDIKHSDDFHAFKDIREANKDKNQDSKCKKRNKKIAKHKSQYTKECDKDFQEIHKILRSRKVSKKELVDYVVADVKQDYLRKNNNVKKADNLKEYTSTEGWLLSK